MQLYQMDAWNISTLGLYVNKLLLMGLKDNLKSLWASEHQQTLKFLGYSKAVIAKGVQII